MSKVKHRAGIKGVSRRAVQYACVLLVMAAPGGWAGTNGPEEGEPIHIFNVGLETYRYDIVTALADFRFDPAGLRLGYSALIRGKWYLNAGYGAVRDSIDTLEGSGDFDSRYYTASAGYFGERWSASLRYFSASSEAQLARQGAISGSLDDTADYSGIGIEAGRDWMLGQTTLYLGGFLEFQSQRARTTLRAQSAEAELVERTRIDSDGWLAGLTVGVSHLFILGSKGIIPSLSALWAESVSGETFGTNVIGWRSYSSNVRRSSSADVRGANPSRGQVDVNLAFLFGRFSFDVGAAFPFDSEFSRASFEDGRRYYLNLTWQR